MEILVAKEVKRQLRQLPPNLAKYIEQVEVATYALNRLPPLYASSEEGLRQQQLRGEKNFAEQIATAVRQALAAVQRDPLRISTPLAPEEGSEYHDAYIALQDLQELLQQDVLNWRNLASTVRHTLLQAIQGDLTQQQMNRITRRVDRKHSRYRGL